ncbi:hypothetical protein CC86DRAFT_410199 [Ophiobolus disseminans]|uniref:DUF7730 domain-containing protein n=1 Tax=Ophiobolus disseminans TaxID=1469910 RepID=A0A6A6ZPB5_9PLEO|nr:hypothetical protein CC86DRAFT_410199 [Ophiobolus disseminans]
MESLPTSSQGVEYQKPVEAQTISFLALPYELRLMVYHHILALDQPIELWVETGYALKNQRCRRVNAAILWRTFRRGGDVNLGFLCTCKLVNFEATEIFYGENKFRFSGNNGLMTAYAYITKIGR